MLKFFEGPAKVVEKIAQVTSHSSRQLTNPGSICTTMGTRPGRFGTRRRCCWSTPTILSRRVFPRNTISRISEPICNDNYHTFALGRDQTCDAIFDGKSYFWEIVAAMRSDWRFLDHVVDRDGVLPCPCIALPPLQTPFLFLSLSHTHAHTSLSLSLTHTHTSTHTHTHTHTHTQTHTHKHIHTHTHTHTLPP